MDLNLVAAFVRVVEAQSFTRAARELGLPKSSVSRRITDLEKQLGVQLLRRTTRKLSLTEAGRAYFTQAERAISELSAAADAALGMDSEPRGVVRMTAPVDLVLMGFADLVAEFARLYPEIHVEVCLDSEPVNLVERGFDIAVRIGPIADDPSLVSRKFGSTDLGLFAAGAYLERRGTPTSLADLAHHDLVLFRAQNGKAVWRLDGPNDRATTLEVTGSVSTNEMLFVQQAVVAGLGIGLLPVASFECRGRECPGLGPAPKQVLPEYGVRGVALRVLTAEGARRPLRVTLFRDFLVERLKTRCQAHTPG